MKAIFPVWMKRIQELREQASGNALRKQQLEGQVRLLQEQISSSAEKPGAVRAENHLPWKKRYAEKRRAFPASKGSGKHWKKNGRRRWRKSRTQEQALDRLRQEIGAREQEGEKARGEMIALLNQRSSPKERSRDTMPCWSRSASAGRNWPENF